MERKRKRKKPSEDVRAPNKRKKTEDDADEGVNGDAAAGTSASGDAAVNGRIPKNPMIRCNPLKPWRKSWLAHISHLVLMRCLEKAKSKEFESLNPVDSVDINWEEWAGSLLTPDDVRAICFYVSKEYPEPEDLSDASHMVEPYRNLEIASLFELDNRLKLKPLQPKPPVTAFFQFVKSMKGKLLEKHPELTHTQITKKLSEKWRSLSEERKLKYKEKYQREREQYKIDLEQFYIDHPEAQPQTKRRKQTHEVHSSLDHIEKRRLKELQQMVPKTPTTPFFLFCMAKRATLTTKYPEMSSIDVTRKLGIKWKSMSLAKKEKYKQAYLKNREAYTQQMVQFAIEHPGVLEEIKQLKMRETEKRKRLVAEKNIQVGPKKIDHKKTVEDEEEDEEEEEEEDEEEEEEEKCAENEGNTDAETDSDHNYCS